MAFSRCSDMSQEFAAMLVELFGRERTARSAARHSK